MLDAAAYPHIFDAIFAAAPSTTFPALRATSRELRNAVDARLARRILVFADGRIASRLAPRGRLPRPLAELGAHVRVLDWQHPASFFDSLGSFPWKDWELTRTHSDERLTPDRRVWDGLSGLMDALTLPSIAFSGWLCPCGRLCAQPPAHLASFADPGLLPALQTVCTWGSHDCWTPRAHVRLQFQGDTTLGFPPLIHLYIHSPAAASRFNIIKVGDELHRRVVWAGMHTECLLKASIDLRRLEEQASTHAQDPQEVTQVVRTPTEIAELFAALLARWIATAFSEAFSEAAFVEPIPTNPTRKYAALLAEWLTFTDGHDDEVGDFVLVDVEAWPGFEGLGAVRDVLSETLQEYCTRYGNAGRADKVRFITTTQYEEEMGEEAALEADEHWWKFE